MSTSTISFACEVRKMCLNGQRGGFFEQNLLMLIWSRSISFKVFLFEYEGHPIPTTCILSLLC